MIVDLARTLELEVIAEGIETAASSTRCASSASSSARATSSAARRAPPRLGRSTRA